MKNISISKKGILNLINNINPRKAVGPDNIAGKILKENADICSDILTINLEILACNLLGGVCLPLTGVTFVWFQSSGTCPVSTDFL
jgi:hypothetical protein